MPAALVTVVWLDCLHCGHGWESRARTDTVCPECGRRRRVPKGARRYHPEGEHPAAEIAPPPAPAAAPAPRPTPSLSHPTPTVPTAPVPRVEPIYPPPRPEGPQRRAQAGGQQRSPVIFGMPTLPVRERPPGGCHFTGHHRPDEPCPFRVGIVTLKITHGRQSLKIDACPEHQRSIERQVGLRQAGLRQVAPIA